VRNMEATKLAATLNEVFKEEDKKEALPRQGNTEAQTLIDTPEALQQYLTAPRGNEGGALPVSAALKVNIVASEDSNSLIIRARPRDYRQLLETIAQLDQVPKEVMINMVVAEVSLTESTRFGINWQALLGRNLGERYRTVVANTFAGVAANVSGLVIDYAGNTISAMLNLIATDNDVQVLSRPSILVRNNQEASMNVGSDEPTITRLNTTSQATTTNYLTTSNEVQYRNTGIILKVTPHINEDGIINIQVSQEVSSLGAVRTEQQLPSFTTRKFETSLLVRDGNAIILGGLIESRINNDLSGLPGLMQVPIVGQAFSSQNKSISRTELVVIIIPEIIDPEADNRIYMEAFTQRMKSVANILNEQPIALIDFMPTLPRP
jgi:general secretion pathway protein D